MDAHRLLSFDASSRPSASMQSIWDGQNGWQNTVRFRDSSPYGAVRANSPGTPRVMPGSTGITKEEMAEMLRPMQGSLSTINEKLSGPQTYVKQVDDNVNQTWKTMDERTQALNTRLINIEQSNSQVIASAAEAAVTASMAKVGVTVGQLQREMAAMKSGQQAVHTRGSGGRDRAQNGPEMSEQEQIKEIRDKIEFRFTSGELEPENDAEAEAILEELLRSADIEMNMHSAKAEFNRKFMMRRGGGRQQLRIWAQFPSAVERHECYHAVILDQLRHRNI